MPNAETTGPTTVLVIDDEVAFLRHLRTGLEDLGYKVAVARDGREGLKTFASAAADLVLVDLWMPGDEWIGSGRGTAGDG